MLAKLANFACSLFDLFYYCCDLLLGLDLLAWLRPSKSSTLVVGRIALLLVALLLLVVVARATPTSSS